MVFRYEVCTVEVASDARGFEASAGAGAFGPLHGGLVVSTRAFNCAGVAGVARGVIGTGQSPLLAALAMTASFLIIFLVGLALVVAGIAFAIKNSS